MRRGTVYLLHFDRPLHHARHYLGFTTDLADRMVRHASGNGAKLVAAVRAAGIGWTLARTWVDVPRELERRLKARKRIRRRCPICSPNAGALP